MLLVKNSIDLSLRFEIEMGEEVGDGYGSPCGIWHRDHDLFLIEFPLANDAACLVMDVELTIKATALGEAHVFFGKCA